MKYKSEIYEVVHQDALACFEVGAISEAKMREYDEMCLVKETETETEYTQKPRKEQVPVIGIA